MSSWGWGHVLPVHPELHTVGCHFGTLCVRSPCQEITDVSVAISGQVQVLQACGAQPNNRALKDWKDCQVVVLHGGSTAPWGHYGCDSTWSWSWHLVPRAPECSQCSRTWINSTINPFSCQGEGNTQWKLSPEVICPVNTRARNRICVTDLGPWTL